MARNVTIQRVLPSPTTDNSTGGAFSGGVFTPNADDAIADVDAIEAILNGGTDVAINTNDGTGAQPGNIVLASGIDPGVSGTQTLRLNAENDVIVNAGRSITQSPSAGALNIVLNADSDANGAGRISLAGTTGNVVTFSTHGGNISFGGRDTTLTGTVGDATHYATGNATNGVGVQLDFASLVTSGGAITMAGRAGGILVINSVDAGIVVSNSTLNSGGGTITLIGEGVANAVNASRGIIVQLGSDVNAAGGNIVISGTGGAGTSDNNGVAIGGGAAQTVRTVGTGTIEITGTGGSGGSGSNDGLLFYDTAFSTVDGAITLVGTGGTVGTLNDGMRFGFNTQIVSTGSGAITLTGTGNGGGAGIAANSQTGNFGPGGTVRIGQGLTGTYTGDISLNSLGGSSIDLGGAPDVGLGAGFAAVGTTGTVTANAGTGAITLASGSSISGTAGVTLTADNMALSGTTTGASVTLQTSTAGRQIDLGTDTAGSLGLTSAELNTITASGGTLTIGRNDASASGNITISDTIAPTGATTLVLRTGGSITQTAGTVSETNLGMVAGTGVTLTAAGNNVSSLSGRVTGSGDFSYRNANTFTVSSNVAVNATATTGIQTADGSITLQGTQITLGADLLTNGSGGAGSAVTITGQVVLATGTVTVDTDSIGANGAGNVTFGNAIEGAATGANTLIVDAHDTGGLGLDAGGAVTFGGTVGATTRLAALAVAGSGVTFTGTNNVDTLAIALSGLGNAVSFTDADGFTVGTAGGITGITTIFGAVTLRATTGNINLNNGAVQSGGPISLFASAGAITDADGGTTASITGYSLTFTAATGFGSAEAIDTNVNTFSGTNSTSGNIRVREASGIDLAGISTQGGNGNIAIETVNGSITTSSTVIANGSGSVALTAGGAGSTLTISNAISSTSGDITLTAADALTLNGSVSTTGALVLNAGGATTLNLSLSGFASLTTDAAGTTAINGGSVTTTGAQTYHDAVTLGNATNLTGTAITFDSTVDNNGNLLTATNSGAGLFTGSISGGGGFTQAGAGTTTLAATNLYTGATTINAGTLLVNGSIASATTTVNNTGTLGGTNGTVQAINIASGGTLSPGASAGKLTATGAVTFNSGATFKVELGGTTAGTDYDQLVAGGTVSLANATLSGALIGGGPAVGTQYKIIDKTSTGAVLGTFNGLANGGTANIGGRAFQINYAGGDGNDVTLSLGALKISGTDPVNVLADVNATTVNSTNSTSPIDSVERNQQFSADLTATVNAGVTVDGWGLALTTTKTDGTITVTNNGSILANAAGAGAALLLTGGGVNVVNAIGTISGATGIQAVGGTTNVIVTGTVAGTGGTAISFDNTSSGNTVDLKPTAVITGNLSGSGEDLLRLSGASGSSNFDLDKIAGGFSELRKSDNATWTVTGTFAPTDAVTTVVNGALLVNGTLGGDAFVGTAFSDSLLAAPLLGGTGSVADVLVRNGGVLAPGVSAGTLTVTGNLTMTGGSILRIEIGGAGAGQFDVLNVTGTAAGTGAIELGGATLTGSLIGGFTPALGQVFEIINNAGSDAILSPFNGISEGAGVNFGGQTFTVSYIGGDGNDVTLTAASNGVPGLTGLAPTVNVTQAGPDATPQILDSDVVFTDVEGNFSGGTLVVSGLLPEDTVSVFAIGFDPGMFFIDEQGAVDDLYYEGAPIGTITGGNGTALTITFNGNATTSAVDALIQNLTFLDTSSNPAFSRTLSVNVTDSTGASTGPKSMLVHAFNGEIDFGGPGDDSFAPTGNAHIDAGGGIDTITFNFRLVDATVTYSGNQVIIDGPSEHMVLSGFEVFNFTDGTVNNNDGDVLVDDLFYYSRYHDVWNAHVDADAHYHGPGWHEGRDPNAFFSTMIYLSANSDVKAAGVDPLSHFDQSGWKEGRVPSINFDPAQYLAANPDVKAANIDPLAHFLGNGAGEGRLPFAPTELVTGNGFDYVYYLNNNPDVKAAGVDPFQHFQQFGWHEGRNPNALFDTQGYLANYADVAAANVNPLDHYNTFGWLEGRDPSVNFDTTSYLAAYADVNAAHVNPLNHFLQFGIHEGRSGFADGVWG
jgi:hypothetical protein